MADENEVLPDASDTVESSHPDVPTQSSPARRPPTDLELAPLVKWTLSPVDLPLIDGYRIAASHHSCGLYSTEFYDVRADSNGGYWICVGSCVGNHVYSSMLLTQLTGALAATLPYVRRPEQAMSRLNQAFCALHRVDGRFASAVLLYLDTDSHRLSIVNAGHPDPVYRQREGPAHDIGMQSIGIPLGLDCGFNYASHESGIQPGDSIVMFGDGTIETWTEELHLGRQDDFRSFVAGIPSENAHEIVKTLENRLTCRSDPMPSYNDCTVLALARV